MRVSKAPVEHRLGFCEQKAGSEDLFAKFAIFLNIQFSASDYILREC